MFQPYIREPHIDFQEVKLGNIAITSLLLQIEDKIWVLKHAREWINAETTQPSAMALAADSKLPTQLEDILSKQIKTQLFQFFEQNKTLTNHNTNNTNKTGVVHQEGMFVPPSTPRETRQYNNKKFNWCTTCR